jgi:hypothetical protein
VITKPSRPQGTKLFLHQQGTNFAKPSSNDGEQCPCTSRTLRYRRALQHRKMDFELRWEFSFVFATELQKQKKLIRSDRLPGLPKSRCGTVMSLQTPFEQPPTQTPCPPQSKRKTTLPQLPKSKTPTKHDIWYKTSPKFQIKYQIPSPTRAGTITPTPKLHPPTLHQTRLSHPPIQPLAKANRARRRRRRLLVSYRSIVCRGWEVIVVSQTWGVLHGAGDVLR